MSKHSTPLIVSAKRKPGRFDLPLPDGLEDQLNPEQAQQVSKVQVKYAQGVGQLLTKSYGEVSDILGETPAKPAPRATAPKTKANT